MPPAATPNRSKLTEGPIARTLLVFALPILASNVLQSLNASVNAMWIGHYLGEAALTATSNASLVMFFLLGLVFGVAMANTILTGQAIGAGDVQHAKRVIGTSTVFFLLLSGGVAALGWIFTPPILALMRTPADAQPYAVAYLRVIFLAMPFMYFNSFLGMTLRGAGDSRTPFLFLIIAVILDITLNPLLIFGVGPLPRMGIAGSALATLVAQVIAVAALLIHLYRSNHRLRLGRGELHYLRPDPQILRALVTKGLPMGLQMVVISLASIVMIALVNGYGSRTTAAYGAAVQLWTYIQMPALAIGAAVSSMAAQNVGAQRWDRVARIAGAGVGFNFLLTGALVALVYLFNRHALGLFLPHDTVALTIAGHLNRIVVWSFVFFGISFVLFGVIRSTGAVLPPLGVLFVALWLVRLPFAWLLHGRFGVDAIWWSFPLGALATMLLAIAYYRFGGWRRARMLRPTPASASTPTTGVASATAAAEAAALTD